VGEWSFGRRSEHGKVWLLVSVCCLFSGCFFHGLVFDECDNAQEESWPEALTWMYLCGWQLELAATI